MAQSSSYRIHCTVCNRETQHTRDLRCMVCDTWNRPRKREKVTYHTCPECEANFPSTQLVEGKLPPHKFAGRVCPGSFNKNPRTQQTRAMRQAVKLHRAFTGRSPTKGQKIALAPLPRAGVVLGRLIQVGYESTRDGANYLHKFRKNSRPLLVASHDGKQALIVGGRFVITGRGIEDR